MTQIATAVTPSAIIIGADSAVLITIGGIRHPLVYTGVHKLFQWEAHGILVGMFGSFPLEVEGQPFDIWMRNWHKVGREQPLDLDGLLNQLTGDLNDKVRALLPAGGLMWLCGFSLLNGPPPRSLWCSKSPTKPARSNRDPFFRITRLKRSTDTVQVKIGQAFP